VTFGRGCRSRRRSPPSRPTPAGCLHGAQWEASERDKDRMECARTSGRWPPTAVRPASRSPSASGPSHSRSGRRRRFISFVSRVHRRSGDDPPRPQILVMPSDGARRGRSPARKKACRLSGRRQQPDRVSDTGSTQRGDEARTRGERERVFEKDFRWAHILDIDVASKSATRLTEGRHSRSRAPSCPPTVHASRLPPSRRRMSRDYRPTSTSPTWRPDAEKITTNPGSEDQPQWSPTARASRHFGDADGTGDRRRTIPAMVGTRA